MRKAERKRAEGFVWIKTGHSGGTQRQENPSDLFNFKGLGRYISLLESTPWMAGSDRSSPSSIRQPKHRQSTNPHLNGTQWESSRTCSSNSNFCGYWVEYFMTWRPTAVRQVTVSALPVVSGKRSLESSLAARTHHPISNKHMEAIKFSRTSQPFITVPK